MRNPELPIFWTLVLFAICAGNAQSIEISQPLQDEAGRGHLMPATVIQEDRFSLPRIPSAVSPVLASPADNTLETASAPARKIPSNRAMQELLDRSAVQKRNQLPAERLAIRKIIDRSLNHRELPTLQGDSIDASNASGHKADIEIQDGPQVDEDRDVKDATTSEETPAAAKNEASANRKIETAPPSNAIRPFVPSAAVLSLKRPLERCLSVYDHQYLNTREHACWSTMHLLLAHGPRSRIHVGAHGATTVSTVDWLCQNRPCSGHRVYYADGQLIRGRIGPGFQGHEGQLLAIFAQIDLPISQPLIVDGHRFTIADLVRSEQLTCKEGAELTFKLIGLLNYLPSDTTWTSEDGTEWHFPKLIRTELSEKINGAACGGTHRIMAISHAAVVRRQRGEPVTGEWWRAEKYMKDYQRYAFSLQNPDGSFSTDWFKGRANRGDEDRKLQTTGHILEWLVYSLSQDQLNDPRIVRSVAFLTNLMAANRFHDWNKGPKGHALRALDRYYNRTFGPREIRPEPSVYDRPRPSDNHSRSIFSRLKGRFN